MEVLLLTLVLSLVLAVLFMILFYRDRTRNRFASSESDALLPFEEEKPKAAESETSAEP